MQKERHVVIAGIPATTRRVFASYNTKVDVEKTGKRKIPLTLPRVRWLERPEICKELK